MIAAIALIGQLAVTAHAPPTAVACEAIELTVAVTTSQGAPPEVTLPPLGVFELLRQTPRAAVRQLAGSGSSALYEFRYVITTDVAGTHQIGPFEVRSGEGVARSFPVAVRVLPVPSEGGVPTVVARARIDTSRHVSFEATTEPDTVLVGEQAFYEVAVFLNGAVRRRLRRNPTFFPPDMVSMLAYEVPMGLGEPPQRRISRDCFDALVYRRAIFPLVPGRHAIPPAQLVYSLPQGTSFFSREESFELQTDSTIVIAVLPPADGQPGDYRGAVGRLGVDTRIDSREPRVGDPVIVTVGVSGSGNVNLFPRPDLAVNWGSLVPGPERVTMDSTAQVIGGRKEFDWILTPYQDGDLILPEVRYPYFDPANRRYQTAVSDAIRIYVAPGFIARADTLVDEHLPIRRSYSGPAPAPLHHRPAYWVVMALMPLPLLLTGRRRRAPAASPIITPAMRLAALAADDEQPDPAAMRRVFGAALSERIGMTAATLTTPGAVERALCRAGVTAETAARCDMLMRDLEAAAFGGDRQTELDPGTARRACELLVRVDSEALSRSSMQFAGRRSSFRGPMAIVLLAVVGGTAVAQIPASQRFEKAVRDFDAGQMDAARSGFAAAAAVEPGSADAWFNFGTAAWHSGDTISAVHGWQRAMRLEPTAADARAHLRLAGNDGVWLPGDVTPIGRSTPAAIAMILWALVCALLFAGRRFPGSDRLRRAAVASGAAASIVLLLLAFYMDDELRGDELAVMASSVLRAAPGLGAEATTRAPAGAVARVERRSGAWSLVDLGDDRRGWVESGTLLRLGDPPRPRSSAVAFPDAQDRRPPELRRRPDRGG